MPARMLGRWIAGCALLAPIAGGVLGCGGGHSSPPAARAATLGCPQAALKRQPPLRDVDHLPARAVLACIGTRPITGAQFARRFAIERRRLGKQDADIVASATLDSLIGDADHPPTTCAHAVGNGLSCALIAPARNGPPAIGVADVPDGIAVDPVSDTVYVVAAERLVLIDGRACNATTTTGCAHPRVIALPHTSGHGMAIDATTGTIYLADTGTESGVDVIDARTCNATTVSGCSKATPVRLGRDIVPAQPVIDPATRTVYVRDDGPFVSVIDARRCNALDRSGCAQSPARLRTSDEIPAGLAVSPATGTLYVGNVDDNDVSVIDARTCSATDTSGCPARWPAFALKGPPVAMAVDPPTGALYVASNDEKLDVVDVARCRGAILTGCSRRRVVAIPGERPNAAIAIDAPAHTAYISAIGTDGVALLDTATCNPRKGSGCARIPRQAHVGPLPTGLAVDKRTRTVYVLDSAGESVSLIAVDRCNAAVTRGC
jgi:DNA-binding beta-propeller fold protein YncE